MKKEYNVAIDILRILSILAVILIHTTITTIQASKYALSSHLFTLFLNQIAIFAVPMFFLISGFVLELHYKQLDYIGFFKKRATKIIIPYIFWSLFYFFMYPGGHPKNASLFYLLVSGKASYQLYFIPAIIIFYSLFPLLHAGIYWLRKPVVILSLIFLQLVILGRSYYVQDFSIEPSLRAIIHCFAFFPLGMVASHYQDQIRFFVKNKIKWMYIIIFLCIFIAFVESYWLYINTKKLHSFYSQFHLIVLPYTFSLAALLFYVFSGKETGKKFIMTLSQLSFFVFFIHISLMFLVWDNFGQQIFHFTRSTISGKMFFDIFFFSCVTTLSFILAAIAHKIPYLSKLTG